MFENIQASVKLLFTIAITWACDYQMFVQDLVVDSVYRYQNLKLIKIYNNTNDLYL